MASRETHVTPRNAKRCTGRGPDGRGCALLVTRRVPGEPVMCGLCALDARIAEHTARVAAERAGPRA